MYLLKPVLQACSILAMRIGQTIAKLVFWHEARTGGSASGF
jgi:hypothetical protein